MKRASALPLFELQFGVYILPCFLLIHDLELNPGPPRSLGKTNRKVHVTIAHFNVRSMASHESSTWSSKRLLTITTICSSSLNPGSTLPQLITTFKFQDMSFLIIIIIIIGHTMIKHFII